jgi:sensor histidine kinase YesM
LQAAQEEYLFDLALANERTEQERIKAEEQLKHEQAVAEEKNNSGLVLATTKAKQEREKAAIKRRNGILMIGAGMLFFVLVFVFIYLRQRTLRQRAFEKAEAVHKMAELELQSLRAQLNPHFMFNSLNAIQELILMEDNERSHTYLSRFSKLIRLLLDNASQPFIPLKKEIDFLELYLSLEKLRIPDLEYSIETEPGIDTNRTTIPNMMMQPYIENAIWHGLSPKQGEKKLAIKISRNNGSIQYEIEDNGIGMNEEVQKKVFEMFYRGDERSQGTGLGLYIVKSTVEKLQGTIELKSEKNKGSLFTLYLPSLS